MSLLYSKTFGRLQTLRTALAVFFLLPALAQAMPQEYSILAVGVDTSRSKAEAYAMDYARKRAVFLAASKMGVSDPAKAITQIKPELMPQIIRGATVQKTQRLGEKTYQQISVTIAEDALRAALNIKDSAAKPQDNVKHHSVLVIPVTVAPERTWVWEKENILRAPLSEELLRQSRGMVMLPSGDLQDLRLIDRENALKIEGEELLPMFERYGAEEILVAAMQLGPEKTIEPTRIILHRVTTKGVRDEALETVPEGENDTVEARTLAAARAIASAATQIASTTEEDPEDKLAKATKIKLRFVYATPKELAKLTESIRKAPGVLRLELPAIMLNNASGLIYLDGEKTALRKTLAAQGIVIRDLGEEWTASAR